MPFSLLLRVGAELPAVTTGSEMNDDPVRQPDGYCYEGCYEARLFFEFDGAVIEADRFPSSAVDVWARMERLHPDFDVELPLVPIPLDPTDVAPTPATPRHVHLISQHESEISTGGSIFSRPMFPMPPMRHDVFDYTRWVDTGSWATDLPVSLGASVSNIAAYMFNSAVNILALPEDVARALGMSDQEIHELNFVLLMTGLTEARMAAQSIRTGPAWLIGRLKLLTTTSRLRAGYVTATPEFSARVWRLIPFIRGQLIELILRLTQYAKWTHIGAWDRGFWPLIDFQRGRSVVSLKTIDPWTKTYDDRLLKLASHADELANATITVDGVAVTERILDIRVPQGTGATVIAEMVDTILEVAEGVTIAISEF